MGTVALSATSVQFIDTGDERFYETYAYPVYDEKGKVTRIAILACDVTEHKKSEDKIRESEKRFREFVDQLPQTVSEFDLNGMHTFVNRKGFETFGSTPEDLVKGVHILDVIAPEDRERAGKNLERRLKGEIFGSSQYTMVRKDATRFPALIHTSPVFCDNKPVGFRCLVVDITEQRRAEEALRESEERYRGIFENAVLGIFQSSPEGRFIRVNNAFALMHCYATPAKMIGATTDIAEQRYTNPEDRIRFRKILEEHGVVRFFEARFYRKDNSTVWLLMNARAATDSGGRMLYYEGTVEDITERKSLEAQLRQSQKMEAIGQLAGGIAHDFNNILTALIGYGSLLQMNMDENDRLRAYVNQILASSQKAADLTRGLLAFSRKQTIALRPCKVNTIIANVEGLLRRLLTEDIDLRMSLAGKVLTIMADATQIEQVLLNLATNARDSMPQGGVLSIETSEVKLDHEFAGVNESGEPGPYALISVKDTGTGMDERTKEKMFEPFFTTKEAGRGTGLGLSIVYGIVKQHNGYITVSSDPGSGTAFSIFLPLAKTQAESTPRTFTDSRGGDETILIAEDNREARNLIKEILTRSGYTVVEAVDGEDAIARFMEHQSKISLLILDVVMPRKNGKEVYDAIQELRPGIKAIFTSGYTDDVVFEKGIHGKSVEFISKPVPIGELLSRIRTVLDD